MTSPQDQEGHQDPTGQPPRPRKTQGEQEDALLEELAKRLMGSDTFQTAVAGGVKRSLEGMNLGTIISQSVNAAIDQRISASQAEQQKAGGGNPPANPQALGELAALVRALGLGGDRGDLSQMESMGKMMASFFGNVLGPVQQLYDAGRRDYASQLTVMARAGMPVTVEGLEAASAPKTGAAPAVAHQQQEPDLGDAIRSVARGIRLTP